MKIQNTTHYYNEFSKRVNEVIDPASFAGESRKRQSYMQRMYFEQLYCDSVHGIGFFYTCTYNNESLPVNRGFPTHSYQHIREITNGAMVKRLKRQYGAKLHYFCCCELGEGKGVRGKGNNPHLHLLLWVLPLDDKTPFTPPDPKEMYELILSVWPYGFIQPGNNMGVIDNTKMCFSYVSKYVTKDIVTQNRLNEVFKDYNKEFFVKEHTYSTLYQYYLHCKHEYNISKNQFISMFHLFDFKLLRKITQIGDGSPYNLYDFFNIPSIHQNFPVISQPGTNVLSAFYAWYIDYIYPKVKTMVRQFWNMYGTKCRMSNNLGIYGLQFIKNIECDPYFIITDSSGPRSYSPCLYYMRKLYYEVVKDPVSGNPLYILNDLGITQRCNLLRLRIHNYTNLVTDAINSYNHNVFDSQKLYPLKYVDPLWHNYVIYAYVVYKLVYEYRSYSVLNNVDITPDLSEVDIINDYRRFIRSPFKTQPYRLSLCDTNRNSISFSSHPAFSKYIQVFGQLDDLLSHYVELLDKKRKDDFESKRQLLKIHSFLNFSS